MNNDVPVGRKKSNTHRLSCRKRNGESRLLAVKEKTWIPDQDHRNDNAGSILKVNNDDPVDKKENHTHRLSCPKLDPESRLLAVKTNYRSVPALPKGRKEYLI
jgi:hypothetical protein